MFCAFLNSLSVSYMCDVHDVTYFGVTCELDHPGLKCSCKMRSLKEIQAAMDNSKPISKTEKIWFNKRLETIYKLTKIREKLLFPRDTLLPGVIENILSSLDPVGVDTEIGPDGWKQVETLDLRVTPYSIATLSDGRIVSGATSLVKIFKERIDGAGGWDCVNLTGHSGAVYCVAALRGGQPPSPLVRWSRRQYEVRPPVTPFGSEDESAGASATKEDESADADKSTKVLSPRGATPLMGETAQLSTKVFASPPSELRFVTGGQDATVKVWKESLLQSTGGGSPKSDAWSVEVTLTGHSDYVRCVAVLPPLRCEAGPYGVEDADGSTKARFVTGSDDMTVKVWKESSLQSTGGGSPKSGAWSVEATLTGHSHWVLCVAVLADGRFVTGSRDKTVKVWKENSPGSGVWSVEATLTGHREMVSCVAVLADGRFVTGSWDWTVKVWEEKTPGSGAWSVEATLTGHGLGVRCVAVLADGRLVTGSEDKTVKVWKESLLSRLSTTPPDQRRGLATPPDQRGGGSWSLEATLTKHGDWVRCVAVLAGGRLATGSDDNTIKVWG